MPERPVVFVVDAAGAIPPGVMRFGPCFLIVDDATDRGTDRSLARDAHMLPVEELAREVIDGFQLTKTELGTLMGVSRQAVHAWLRGSRIDADRHVKMRGLWILLQELGAAGVERPSLALTCPLFAGDRSAADLIRAEEWSHERDCSVVVDQMLRRSVRPYLVDDPRKLAGRLAQATALLSRDE